jgi:hypothetical protein
MRQAAAAAARFIVTVERTPAELSAFHSNCFQHLSHRIAPSARHAATSWLQGA